MKDSSKINVGFLSFFAGLIAGVLLLAVIILASVRFTSAHAGEGGGDAWAIEEQGRQIKSLHKRLSRLETLPTNRREEQKRREEEERR